ncbi:E3 ubiquitin/ISG15 ligase TRIM25-like [Bufo bufo]|uniref:E3 ubiquitin/ISG15 ligase TRIM25-like n=1 Tax=Bufo bufo TaxID=8384 RepID=UPI001ABE665E|nr:E3 ubiquitin/ISG15 ligase TRIM25-like [Bufo bufo]
MTNLKNPSTVWHYAKRESSWIEVLETFCFSLASADVRDELSCSICLNIYTDPVTLRCGHNFSPGVYDRALDTQEASGIYTCPECREEFEERPLLYTSIALRNIAEHFQTVQPESVILCTYCNHSPTPARKSCLSCKVSLCERHLRVHSKSREHVLAEPTASIEDKKCSIHKKTLEYYCLEDATFICVTCCLASEHQGHQVELLEEAAKKKKDKMNILLRNLNSKKAETEKKFQDLQEGRRRVQEKAAGIRKRVTVIFRDIKRQLEDLEKKVLNDISKQQDVVTSTASNLIQQLEVQKDEIYSKILYVKELCNMTEAVAILQEQESNGDHFCGFLRGEYEDERGNANKVDTVDNLDEDLISETLLQGLSQILKNSKKGIHVQVPTDIHLDVNTACKNVKISHDLKTASWSQTKLNRPETTRRFQDPQVLSSRSFSTGRHYFEVETSKTGNWRVGLCYPSIDRNGHQSWIGDNKKSWCLRKVYYNNSNLYSVMHDSKVIQLPQQLSSHKFRVYLDYEAGQLCFYEVNDSIRHLHTFTTTFIEPLHAAFCVLKDGCIKISS